jgi:hypothetical protein
VRTPEPDRSKARASFAISEEGKSSTEVLADKLVIGVFEDMGVPVEEAVVEEPLALPPFSAFLANRACLDFEAIIFQRQKRRRGQSCSKQQYEPFSRALMSGIETLSKVRRRWCRSTSIFCKSFRFCSSPTKNACAGHAHTSLTARVLILLEIVTPSALLSRAIAGRFFCLATLGKLLLEPPNRSSTVPLLPACSFNTCFC